LYSFDFRKYLELKAEKELLKLTIGGRIPKKSDFLQEAINSKEIMQRPTTVCLWTKTGLTIHILSLQRQKCLPFLSSEARSCESLQYFVAIYVLK